MNVPWLPTTRPRPANKHQHNLYPDLTVDSLIDPHLRRWNSPAIRALVDPQDVKLIESIPLSRTRMADKDGWHSQIMENTRLNLDIRLKGYIQIRKNH